MILNITAGQLPITKPTGMFGATRMAMAVPLKIMVALEKMPLRKSF